MPNPTCPPLQSRATGEHGAAVFGCDSGGPPFIKEYSMEEIRLEPPAGLNMNVGEAMFSQRAIRRMKPDPISDEHLKIILDAASKAPNGGNRQPGRFLVIRDREKIRAFGELYREAWWCKRRDENKPWTTREEIPDSDKVHQSAALLADEIKSAPVIILAFAMRPGMASSVFPPIQNLLLAARALGIGSTLTSLHPQIMDRVYEMFAVPADAEFHACLPLGYPRGRFGTTRRLSTADTTHWDRWDQAPPWK